MMFDPPDFPYKELRDTLRDEISSDELLFNNEIDFNSTPNNEDNDLVTVTEAIISSVENKLSINSNNSGKFFNVENTPIQITSEINSNIEQIPELYVVQSDNILFNNYEPTLLDDNTVNQFLLPTRISSDVNKGVEASEPALLALHSCVMCQEIFTTEADLLDHTIFAHTSNTTEESTIAYPTVNKSYIDGANSSVDFECEWLVCSQCERVLSTAPELAASEQVCCLDMNGRSSVVSRKLSTMFVCEGCKYLFANGEALNRHKLLCFDDVYYQDQGITSIETNSTQVPLPCDICGSAFESDEALTSHSLSCRRPRQRRPYNTGNTNKMWNCGSCNQLFVTARELYRHKRGEDRAPGAPLMAYVCDECEKVLGSMCALHTHKKMHKVSKPGYPCRVCGRRFNQSGHLAIHMRMHTGERPYPCDLCSKAFKVKVERDDHRRTHTGERPFACAACPKTFTAAARLREHARIHTDHRPYKCEICGAAFRRPYARTVHTLIHTGEKPHACDVCGTAFRRSGDMWKHKRTLHGINAN